MCPSISLQGEARRLTIYIGESDRWHGKQLYMAILEQLRSHGMAGATVTRGVAGFGAHSRIHTYAIERLSEDLPLRIEVVDEAEKIARALDYIAPMVTEGMITVEDVQVVRYTHRYLNPLPADKLVSEVMTSEVVTLRPEMTVAEAWELMLEHVLKALPVVNERQEVVGMLTDEDLLCCVQSTPALVGKMDAAAIEEELKAIRTAKTKVADMMVRQVITVLENESLGVAAARMAKHGLKRLPVLNTAGCLVGVLSRVDILHQVADKAGKTAAIPPMSGQTVGEVMYPQVPTVKPDADLTEVVAGLLATGLRRLIVVDDQNRPLGLISDGDVVMRVAPQEQRNVLAALRRGGRLPKNQATAQALMSEGVLAATPETPLITAAQQMMAEHRKWLVVVDAAGKVTGLVDRQVLLGALAAR